jgi:GT2 family glycosyltransferase
MNTRVLVSIVTHNSSLYLKACLEALQLQTYRDFRIAIWDNASSDETPAIIETCKATLFFSHLSERNVGFCEAHNRLILSGSSEYVLVLNPDVVLDSRFLENLIREMDLDKKAGSATGKLLRQGDTRILDSTGVYFTPSQRHFDRGSNEIDAGQYEKPEYVFGVSGAAAFYRREMLEDTREGTEFFDENFFAYREDVDLAWRALWMGWRCLYVPNAIAYHVRRVLPENRAILPNVINMHSFKNRFLLRVKNMDLGTYACFFIPVTLRDIAALAYVLVRERSSLEGIPKLMRALPRTWAWRKSIQARRRASPEDIRSWFSYTPVALPALKKNSSL